MDTDTTADDRAVTEAQQETWASGDFHEIARQNVVMAEELCVAADPHGGETGPGRRLRQWDGRTGGGSAVLRGHRHRLRPRARRARQDTGGG